MPEIISDFVNVNHEEVTLELFYAYPESSTPLPTVIIFHHWAGRDQFCRDKATNFAKMGYVGIALDLYGNGKVGKSVAENSALMEPLVNDRELLKDRILTIMDHLKKDARIDTHKIVAIGYCFGGLCALDAVRNNVGLKGAISVHGLFNPPPYPLPDTYTAKVLALHGYKDPMVTADQVEAFQSEL
ncbi:MAG TPA: dienelactone hydrolase family protein, partial [Candidatus Nitrosotenuis sp.]|nr:dienelactone hydrolase family protein [Candidatus Nitrosotenuis sp.]